MITYGVVASVAVAALIWLLVKILPFCDDIRRWHAALDNNFIHYPFHWLWGNIHQIKSFKQFYDDTLKFVENGAKSYLFWIGPHRVVVGVAHPETLKTILKTSEPKAKGGGGYDFFTPWLGDGLLVSSGKKWERNRRLLTPAFHFDILHPYVTIYNQSAERFMIKSFKQFYDDTLKFVENGAKSYLFWIGPHRVVVGVAHPETLKTILKTSEPKAKGGGGYDFFTPWLGDGLLVSSGKKWERNRRLLTPAFHFDILHPYVTIYNQSAERFMRKLAVECKDGNSVEVFGPASLATLDTMLQCTLSYTDDVQEKGTAHPYVKAVSRLSSLFLKRSVNLLHYSDFIYRFTSDGKENAVLCEYVHKFSEKIIEARKTALETDPDLLKKQHLDFLDVLLSAKDETGVGLSDKEIRDEVDTFMFEGHDTTSSAISWCLYCLGRYQEEQQKVLQEVLEVIGKKQEVEWEDMAKLQYVPMFIRESIRLYPPVPVVSRQLTKSLVIDGVEVPKGVFIDLNFYQVHRNPHVWPDCLEFKPERFDQDTSAGRDPFSFVPFSAGPRNCIGQTFAMNELKVMICQIVRRFQIELDPEKPAKPIPELILRSENGLFLKFTLRNSSDGQL